MYNIPLLRIQGSSNLSIDMALRFHSLVEILLNRKIYEVSEPAWVNIVVCRIVCVLICALFSRAVFAASLQSVIRRLNIVYNKLCELRNAYGTH